MKTSDDDKQVKVYRAQKTLQMKAGKGDVSQTVVDQAGDRMNAHEEQFMESARRLLVTLNRQIGELEKNIEQEAFTSAPDRQIVLNSVIQTLMDIKSTIGFTNIKSLNDLASTILITLDNSCKIDMQVRDALQGFAKLLSKCTQRTPVMVDNKEVQMLMDQWGKIGNKVR